MWPILNFKKHEKKSWIVGLYINIALGYFIDHAEIADWIIEWVAW